MIFYSKILTRTQPFSIFKYLINRISIAKDNDVTLKFNNYPEIKQNIINSNQRLTFKKYPQKTGIYQISLATKTIVELNSLTVNILSEAFSNHYLLKAQTNNIEEGIQNKILVIKEMKNSLSQNFKRQLDQKQNSMVLQFYQKIKLIYQVLTNAKVGFLRGDLHFQTFFILDRFLAQKIKKFEAISKKRQVLLQLDDFNHLFEKATIKSKWCLPLKGIKNRNLQCKTNLYCRQIILEKCCNDQAHDKIENIMEQLVKLNKITETKVIQKCILNWVTPVTIALQEERKKCKAQESKKQYSSILIKINPQKMATIMITQLVLSIFQSIFKRGAQNFDIDEYEGINEKNYKIKVIKKIEEQILFQREQDQFNTLQKEYDQMKKELYNKQPRIVGQNNWKSDAFKLKEANSKYKFIHPYYRQEYLKDLKLKIRKTNHNFREKNLEHQALGKLIVYLLKELLKVQNQYNYKIPLLESENKIKLINKQYRINSYLRVNKNFLLTIIPKLTKQQNMYLHLDNCLPTIIEPLQWTDPQIGGYFSQPTAAMRYKNCPVQERSIKYSDNYRSFSALNFLGKTPWKINKTVLDLVSAIWDEGGNQNYIPNRYSQLAHVYTTKNMHEKDRNIINKNLKIIKEINNNHSLKCDFLLKFNIAKAFSQIDRIYYPHNFDFRGRVYPLPPHLNHMGNDLCRGLLLFADGKPLGKKGLRWLKIHCANLMGKDKEKLDNKVMFIENNLEKIYKMADQPLKNREWLQYEDSWQAISSIIELSQALRHQNPQSFVSHLHIHQDGSCNGLQHYAAMGRDEEGAFQVNLSPSDQPSDIYTHVSKMVIKMIQDDIEKNPDIEEYKKKLPSNIKRKTIKQTVMTSVYGVTFIGARLQIQRQLKDQKFLEESIVHQASFYIAKLTLKAISQLFKGAHQIKKWFIQCAKLVGSNKNPIGWLSPIGIPIVQPYRKHSKLDRIQTLNSHLSISQQVQNLLINQRKQATAFPPNYVHSLDSTHMIYTAEVAHQKGITFAAVHDSFWTHAATVDQMNQILRDQFIKLHSQPLLQNFKASLELQYPQIKFPQVPEVGTFDLNKIRQSKYFFS